MIKKLTHKRVIVPTMITLGIIMIGLLTISYSSVKAEGDYPSIVKKIAEKFNLNEKDVQAVFDEDRQSHFADMQARWSEKLDDLVNEGKITKEQKDAIVKKHEEMHNKMLELKDLSPEERKTKMQEIHEDLKAWADENGIDLAFVGPMKFKFHGLERGAGDRVFFHEKLD